MNFIEETHKYTEDGVEYTPVSYVLKSFQEWVDWDTIASKKAKKDGTTKENLLTQWADKRDRAAARGTAYHKMKEEELITQGGNIVGYRADSHTGVKIDTSVILENNTTYVEKMIWSKKYSVCGTADLVEVVEGKINIKDYKTNEKLDFESWKSWNGQSKKLTGPVQHLDDCNFNLYQLQVNLYMYMLLQQNRQFKMGEMEVLHVTFDENNIYKETLVYPCMNMQREAKNMLDHHKQTKR